MVTLQHDGEISVNINIINILNIKDLYMRQWVWFLTILILPIANKATGQVFYTQFGHARFHAEMTFGSYTGISNQLEGEIELEERTVHFRVPIESIDTDNDKRNRDMFELMETETFPHAEFIGEIVSGFDPDADGRQEVTVEGVFILRGEQRPVKVTGTIEIGESRIHVEAEWDLFITDFGIDRPRFLINVVDDLHVVYINAYLFRHEEATRM
jgi:polyisoprenoid-binding protein YceI